ncbi:MAG: Uma2 family endonuclease [Saprospiraceae bacterium]
MTDLVKRILNSPDAPRQLEALQQAMADERRRRHEFYEWVTEDIKAEFIQGEIVIHSPVKKRHLNASELLSTLLSVFTRITGAGRIGIEKMMIALTRNDYEPDICFFSDERAAQFHDDQLLFPAPDFVVEILSRSTAGNDRGIKKVDYAAHGIREYWIVDPNRQCIEQYYLPTENATEYFPPKTFRMGEDIESRVIKGFVIPVAAVFDSTANVEALQNLLKNN